MIYNNNDMREFIKPFTIVDTIFIEGDYIKSNLGSFICIMDRDNLFRIHNTIENIEGMISSFSLDYNCENLKDDDVFNQLLECKSGDGVGLYKIDKRFILSIYKNMLPLNKKDTVSLNIYDINPKLYFLSRFVVKKPKNIIINVYIMYLHLSN